MHTSDMGSNNGLDYRQTWKFFLPSTVSLAGSDVMDPIAFLAAQV